MNPDFCYKLGTEANVSRDPYQKSLVTHSLREQLWPFQILVTMHLCQSFSSLNWAHQNGIYAYFSAIYMKICGLV